MPGGPPRCPLSPILPPWGRNPKTRGFSEFRRLLVAETYREEKSISDGQIPPVRSPPGRRDHRHRHHHRHGNHRDHHQHHPQHQHHLHLHPISSHNCNLCCNPYHLPPPTLLVLITTLW